jgi:hypothetical protein
MSPYSSPFIILSVMSSTGSGFLPGYTIRGLVRDDEGNSVNGADVLIRSLVDSRHIVSSGDGSFFSDICVGGSCEEIVVRALYGLKCGTEKIRAHGGHITVDVVIRNKKS